MPSTYYFVLPFAETSEGVRIVLVQRQYVQWRRHGKKLALGHIPQWAGQWGLSGGKAPMEDPAAPTALRLFYEQTGISLEKDATAYGLREIKIEEFRDAGLLPYTVAFAKLTPDGLERLCRDIRQRIDDRDLDSDIVQHVDTFPQYAAQEQLGPGQTPKGGWHVFIIKRIFGGRVPGMFNTTQDIYFMQLKNRSAMQSDWFQRAVKTVSGGSGMPALVGLQIPDESPFEESGAGARTIQVYDRDGFVVIRAVTDPDISPVHHYIKWTGGFEDPSNPHDRRRVRLNQLASRDNPVVVTAELFGQKKSIEIVIVPEFTGLEIDDAEPVAGELYRALFSDFEQFVTVRALVNPPIPEAYAQIRWDGGIACPERPDERRLVSRRQVTQRQHPERVSATLGVTINAEIEIVPAAVELGMSNANQTGPDSWVAEYSGDNADPVMIRATTVPDTRIAWEYIEWTGAKPVSENVATLRVDNLGQTAVTAKLPGNMAEANVKVVPRLVSLDASAVAFPVSDQHWYSYIGHQPPVIVVARTDPPNPTAEAEIKWHGTTGEYKTAGRQTVARDNVGTKTVVAEIPGARRFKIRVDVRRPDAIDGLRLDVTRLHFVDAKPVVDDFNSPIPGVWRRGVAEPVPVCYVRHSPVPLGPVLAVESPAASDQSLDIRATAFFLLAGGTATTVSWSWTANIKAGATDDIDLGRAIGDSPLPDEVCIQDADAATNGYPLAIIWEMKRRSDTDWTEMTTTHHPFYITLAEPLGSVRPYWTELKISCRAANGSKDDRGFVQRVYAAFSGKLADTGVNALLVATSRTVDDGVKNLTYWRNWDKGAAPGQTDSAMLAGNHGNGSCRAFATMLLNMYRLNGIASGRIVAVKPNVALSNEAGEADGFLVRNWQFNDLPAMNVDWTLQTGILNNHWKNGAGQNQLTPPPAFQNHYIVWNDLTQEFYDPSYGSAPQPSELDWENGATDGLYRDPTPDLGFIKQAPGTPQRILKLVKGPASLPY